MPTVFGSWVINSKYKSAPTECAAGLFAQAEAAPASWLGASPEGSRKCVQLERCVFKLLQQPSAYYEIWLESLKRDHVSGENFQIY